MGYNKGQMPIHSDLAADPTARLLPSYVGRGLLNLSASVAQHLGLDTGHAPFVPPLPFDGAETVVLLVVDGLGHFQLRRHLERGDLPNLAGLLSSGEAGYSTATASLPSSTMISLTTLHTGASPAQHGWLGTSVYWRGTVADVLRQRDLLGNAPLEDPRGLIAVPSLYRRLSGVGVASAVLFPREYQGSFLNTWYNDGARTIPYLTPTTLPSLLAEAVASGPSRYLNAYWPGYDSVCHRYGPDSVQATDEVAAVDSALGRMLKQLPRNGKTLLLITADHGHSDMNSHEVVRLDEDAALVDALSAPPAGEEGVRFLKVKLGRAGEVAERLAPDADVISSARAWETGLFGGPPAQAGFLEHTGDLIAVAHPGRQLLWAYGEAPPHVYRGLHGSWSARNMLTPVISLRV